MTSSEIFVWWRLLPNAGLLRVESDIRGVCRPHQERAQTAAILLPLMKTATLPRPHTDWRPKELPIYSRKSIIPVPLNNRTSGVLKS